MKRLLLDAARTIVALGMLKVDFFASHFGRRFDHSRERCRDCSGLVGAKGSGFAAKGST